MQNLVVEQLRSFVLVTDCGSFTGAAELLGTTQSAISLRVNKLEQAIGKRLLARTPRAVSPTPDGMRFLGPAREILAVHDRALSIFDVGAPPMTLRAAIGDHAVGTLLGTALNRLQRAFPTLLFDVSVGLSAEMQTRYDEGRADFAIVRMDTSRRQGIPLYRDQLVWCAKSPEIWKSPAALPLLALPEPCAVRVAAVRALEHANIGWRLAFTGGSVAALQSAASAGLGVAAIGRNQVPADCVVLDQALPVLPAGKITLLTALSDPMRSAVATAFSMEVSRKAMRAGPGAD